MDRRAALLKRLPLLAAVALGLWLWQSDLFPQERELRWEVSDSAQVERLEVQVWKDGELLERAERFGSAELTQKVPLRQGEYQVVAFAWYRGAAQPERWTQTLKISEAKGYAQTLWRSGR